MGRHEEAISVHTKLAGHPLRWALGATYAAAGQPEDARAILADLQEDNAENAWGRAFILANLGDKDGALRSLEAAYEHRHQFMLWFHRVPAFQTLKDRPAFDELLRRVNTGAETRWAIALLARPPAAPDAERHRSGGNHRRM